MAEGTVTYSGKKVFIGVDVHLKSYSIAAVMEGEVVEKATMPASPLGLTEWIGRRYKGAEVYSVYEAGFSGLSLHRELMARGIRNIVINPSSVEISARNRVKTDRRDAVTLAVQLLQGRLRGNRIITQEEEVRRAITRTRQQLVDKRSEVITQIEMKLYYHGLAGGDNSGGRLTIARCRAIIGGIEYRELKAVFKSLLALWAIADREVKALDKLVKKQAERDPLQTLYGSIPGWGTTIAQVVSKELGDMKQFPNERSLFSYSGLTPSEFSSGEHIRKGHISRQGNPRLRKYLVQGALAAIRYDPEIRKQYKTLAARVGGKRAVVACARKMLGWARAMARSNLLYTSAQNQTLLLAA